MATATPETIRNRIATLIAALTPTSDTGVKFVQSRDEAAADFPAWCEANPAACLRRFQVRYDGNDSLPPVSAVDNSLQSATFVILIAYPLTHRYGNGRDRDDVMDEDWRKINYSCGIYGRANFSSTNDCTPLGCERSVERGEKTDMLVVTFRCTFYLDVDA